MGVCWAFRFQARGFQAVWICCGGSYGKDNYFEGVAWDRLCSQASKTTLHPQRSVKPDGTLLRRLQTPVEAPEALASAFTDPKYYSKTLSQIRFLPYATHQRWKLRRSKPQPRNVVLKQGLSWGGYAVRRLRPEEAEVSLP